MFDLVKNDIFDVLKRDDWALKNIFNNLSTEFDSFFGKTFNVDIVEEDDDLIFKAELPGIEKDDLTVDLKNNILTIKADKKRISKTYLRSETYHGILSRSFSIPYQIDEDINASYKDGILTIVLKKKKEPESKRIEIK